MKKDQLLSWSTGLQRALISSQMASLLSFTSLPKPLSTPKVSTSSALSTAPATVSTPERLEEKFGRKGIKFFEYNNVPFVELTVRNGSSLKLCVPKAHVTSYMPKVYWRDDGFEEVLYTDTANSRGGVGLVINDASETSGSGGLSSMISGSEWTVKDTDSDAIDALQVELSYSTQAIDITYVVSLYPLSMATAVLINNNSQKRITLKPGIFSHLKFKNRSGTAIQGLRGCAYTPHSPLPSPFELLSPGEAMKADSSGWFGSDDGEKPGSWSVQDSPVTILEKKISRVYAAPPSERLKAIYNTPPSKYETIDQGRGLFFRMIRIGFEDMYVSSPGSMSEKFGKGYYICTGPASMLVPVVVEPGEMWKGAQIIEHDNL